jgi:hypothetical protein
MVSIYLIEDCDGLKYVGSTDQTLNVRLCKHRYDKKRNHGCSSSKLKLDDCSITELEKCDEENRWEREQYWKDNTDCVNILNTVFDQKEYHKQYYQKNKDTMKQQNKEYYQKNKGKYKEYQKEKRKLDWYCPNCKCNVKLLDKSKHLKTKKHYLNNYLID